MIHHQARLMQLFIALMASILLTACGEQNMNDLRQYISAVKERRADQIESLPEIKSVETFVYLEAGRRDPFVPSAGETAETVPEVVGGISPDFSRRKEELERYPLASLKMVGYLEQQDTAWGLVTADDGTIHMVKQGNYMGQDYGQITHVAENQIEMTEIVSDGLGGYRERTASLTLAE